MIDYLRIHWAILLDAAAKMATVIAAIGIWVAYCQYKHSVKLAQTNERRAAVELAARECARYGSDLIKQLKQLADKIELSGCEYLKHCKLIKESQQLKLDTSAVTEEDRQKMREHSSETVCVVNSLEGFAIPFVRGVADDSVGFVECGRSFVTIFEKYFPLFCISNLQHYYKSSQTLYWRWRKQIEQEELERQHSQAGKEFFVLSEKLVRGKSNSRFALALASLFKKMAEELSKPRT